MEFKGIATITVEINVKVDSKDEAIAFFDTCGLAHPDILLEDEEDKRKIVEIEVKESDWEIKDVIKLEP